MERQIVSQRKRTVDMQLLVNIDVDDLDKAIQFYTDAFDLHLNRRLFQGSVAELVGGTSTIHLLLKPAGTFPFMSSSISRDYQRHWTPLHLDFVVANISDSVERAIRAGAKLDGQITSHAWGHLATMSDPFGHGFCVMQYVGGGYDAAE